ncbi:hypothetical protein OJ532_001641 [Campylobacter coli]|nr:hypothetical protein [Campylobacter coli]
MQPKSIILFFYGYILFFRRQILFGMKFSDDDTGEFNKILSLNSAPKSIDIKA